MDILYMDIVTVEFCQYSHQILVNMFLNSKRMGWDKVIRRGYLYILASWEKHLLGYARISDRIHILYIHCDRHEMERQRQEKERHRVEMEKRKEQEEENALEQVLGYLDRKLDSKIEIFL